MSSRERLLTPYRLAIFAVVAGLALVALLAAKGPAWVQRMYHPLMYEREIAAAARTHDVDPYLVAGVVAAESGFKPAIVSPQGAVGLMQVLPSTAQELVRAGAVDEKVSPIARLSDPDVNLDYGTVYLAGLLERFDDTRTALAAYNAGPGTVAQWLKRPGGGKITYADVAFPETRRYVKRVLREAYYYRRLYPEVASGR